MWTARLFTAAQHRPIQAQITNDGRATHLLHTQGKPFSGNQLISLKFRSWSALLVCFYCVKVTYSVQYHPPNVPAPWHSNTHPALLCL